MSLVCSLVEAILTLFFALAPGPGTSQPIELPRPEMFREILGTQATDPLFVFFPTCPLRQPSVR